MTETQTIARIKDIQYTIETWFAKRRVDYSKSQLIGYSDKRPALEWEWIGMMLAAGRWNRFISAEKRLEILKSILLYANIFDIDIYVDGVCLYAYDPCVADSAYFEPITDISSDEMIKKLEFKSDGVLYLTTTRGVYKTAVPHNWLQGLQGGNPPDEFYHLSKAKHDELNAVPQVAATAAMTVAPQSAQTGSSVSPVINISYNAGTDVITGHTLTRNGVAIPLNPISLPSASQTINDSPISGPATYVYTVNVQDKAPIVITRNIVFALPVFSGITDSEPTEAEIISASVANKTSAMLQLPFSPDDQFVWIAYPKSFGLLTSILNPFDYEQLPAFTQGYPKTVNLTIGSQVVEYYLYVNNLAVSVNAYQLRFYFNS